MSEKLPRPSTEQERLELKAATRRALQLAGRANAFALVTRVEGPVLSKYASPAEQTAFMPVDVVLDLEREAGSPVLTEILAAMQGFRLVPIGEGERQPVGYEDLARLNKESSDVVQSLANGLRDGDLDPAERRGTRQEIAENIAALRLVDRKLAGDA